ncbi:helix-turn-helix domain-containing protein [Streptomyces sp. B1866]|uniref:AraC-like ligand-binding domain-containing protein n=1 Tax=Streptomyces sp. B1866 TaxID=3075431 RepID=UPI00288F290D|nr:helix-turn-helix domain-containing protein [Streptomyces sp. B1866]MDT3399601.1 helix-turn-helix domain-containing protein [Streptomyces sp. B1866]
MAQSHATGDVPACEQFDYFRHLVSNAFVPLDAVPRTEPRVSLERFPAEIRQRSLGAMGISELRTQPHVVSRTPRLIARSDPDYYKLMLQTSGSALIVQDGREARLEAGDFTIYDTTRPYTVACDGPFRVVVFMFPRELLRLHDHEIGRLTATRTDGDHGLGALVSQFLTQLVQRMDEVDGFAGVRLATNVLDLLTTVYAERLDARPADGDATRRALCLRIKQFIEARLSDPGLSPETIAAAHHISVRYLHKLVSAEGLTVSGWIRRRRLECCARDLRDPLLADRPIGTIAAAWGFLDATHFSRAFKMAYGVSPREYRACADSRGCVDLAAIQGG